ncbi:MAG: hypothetical protein WC525_08840 [Candidatus Thermoplasmatota archaeon]
MKLIEKFSVGEWVVIALTILFALVAVFSNSFDMSEGLITKIIGLLIGTFVTLFAIYWVITKVFPDSKKWGAVYWIIVLIGIPVIIQILLVVISNFFFGLGLRFW